MLVQGEKENLDPAYHDALGTYDYVCANKNNGVAKYTRMKDQKEVAFIHKYKKGPYNVEGWKGAVIVLIMGKYNWIKGN